MLSIQEIQALLRACQSDTGRRPQSKTAQGLVNSLGFGRIVGKQWLIAEADRDRIRAYLQEVERIDPATPPNAWQERGRIEATELGRNEKLAGRRPREGRIAVKAPGGLHLSDAVLSLPPRAFLDIPAVELAGVRHDIIFIVENFEAFVCFEDARIELPVCQPLVVFRGDAINTPDAVLDFLRSNKLPVIAWPDLDPAGLLFCSALPRLTGILAPAAPDEYLTRHGRDDLYLNQLRQFDALVLSGESIVLAQSIRKNRKGIDQEKMIADMISLRVWNV